MATTLDFYDDAALTTLKSLVDGITSATITDQVYVGSPTAGIIHQRATLPGTNQLQLTLVDNDTGDVISGTNFKFALSEGGLATATPGAPLNLGTSIASGAAGALLVWYSFTDATGNVAEFLAAVSFAILDVEDAPA